MNGAQALATRSPAGLAVPPVAVTDNGGMATSADELSDRAVESCASIFDPADGGFGSSPKFPQPLCWTSCSGTTWARARPESLAMVEHTLEAMASGGIYDQLGGGFSRYSTDPHWMVPHFEKMLYDQALIARVYLHAWQLDGDPALVAGARRRRSTTCSREMSRPGRRCVLGRGRGLRGRGGPLLPLVAAAS